MATNPTRRMVRGLMVVLFLFALTTVGAIAPTVLAHADYDHSSPAADSIISESPSTVEIWFTQELFRRENANRIEVFTADGTQVDAADSQLDDDVRRHVVVSLPPALAPGIYTVHWYNLSLEDGHEEEGTFIFTIDPTAPAPTETGILSNPEPTNVASPTVEVAEPRPVSTSDDNVGCGGIAVIPFFLGAVWVTKRRKD